MPFQKGQSGNPSGKPKKFTILQFIDYDGVERLVKKAIKLADEGDTKMMSFILEQVFGKAKQTIAGDQEAPLQLIIKRAVEDKNDGDQDNTIAPFPGQSDIQSTEV